MIQFIFGFLTCYLIAMILAAVPGADHEILDYFLFGPMVAIVCVIVLPFLAIWIFFRDALLGVPANKFQRLTEVDGVTARHIAGPIYFCHARRMNYFFQKFALIRVKKS